MALRRGFKTEANVIAVALRHELQLEAHAPLCPWKLAEHLDIPVIKLSEVKLFEPVGVGYLLQNGRDHFSAVTIFVGRHGRTRLIFHNDSHAKTRQRANIAHEIAHAIQCHSSSAIYDSDPEAEAEANWLGPSLLVSEEAALHIAEQDMPHAEAARMYGVSQTLLTMRLNVSGALIRVARRSHSRR
ncbi:MAG: ImmA/IrrE family metallo-endopeptidase [Planctomycetes bacterium]|nr:ImmA/IrrE family metallo-endopeptidase [Planctomycetota bacterium]